MEKKMIRKAKVIPVGYHSSVINLYFYLGVVAALLLRVTLLAELISSDLSKICWYLGVVGYMLFFMHRSRIGQRRGDVIKKLGLLQKIQKKKALDPVDYEGLEYVLWSISVSKEKLNYLIIQIFSAFALLIALIIDVFN